MSARGIRDALKSIVPNWLSDRVQKNAGFKFLYSIALMADGIVETMLEGAQAPLPGVGTPTALSYIGQSRGLIRGLNETDDAYAARLRAWLTTWLEAGSDETMLQLLQSFLGPDASGVPVIRIVNRAGHFTTINADGTFTYTVDTTWNWDSISNPERVGWWSDLWIICYIDPTRWPQYTNLSDTEWIAAWGTYDGLGAGFKIPRAVVDGITQIVSAFKGAHVWVEAIIFTTSPTLFSPPTLTTPNGEWGTWSYMYPNIYQREQVAIREQTYSRYMIPRTGG